MFNDDDICYEAVLELRFDQKKGLWSKCGGGYVHAWTFAPDEETARRNFIDEAPAHTFGRVVGFTAIGPGDPADIQVTDDDVDIMDVPDGEEDKYLRSMTREELEEALADTKVVFALIITWPKKRWWQFWRREE